MCILKEKSYKIRGIRNEKTKLKIKERKWYNINSANNNYYSITYTSLKGESTKYKSKYAGVSIDMSIIYDNSVNRVRIGEGIWEMSISGAGGNNAWNRDYTYIWHAGEPFSVRGGTWTGLDGAGIFSFGRVLGDCQSYVGFRPILIP